MQLSLCFLLFPQWNEERFNIHLIRHCGRGIFEMLMAEIMQNFREISFICTSKTWFCILLDGTVVSPKRCLFKSVTSQGPMEGLA